jgi:CubicO group peptidase (beta-lactamase class C family)
MPAQDFSALHAAMKSQVDRQFLPSVSTVLLQGRNIADTFCYGHADKEAAISLREDHIFRMFSNTKLVTSLAILLLMEDGKLKLDDPVATYIPALGKRQVLRAGATQLNDVEPAKTPITIRHLMTHTSGLSYGVFDPGSLMFNTYNQAGVLSPTTSLAEMVKVLAELPLAFQPGTQWEYSVATDVLGHVVELVSGESFGAFLSHRIFGPLAMIDTDFWVPESKRDRFCALYVGADLFDPTKPGLTRLDDKPFAGAYTQKLPRESGGGGLVSTLGDTVRLIQSLIPGATRSDRATLLKPETLALMSQNHLPEGMCVRFPNAPRDPGWCFGLGSSFKQSAAAYEPAAARGEVGWGGLAGTIWWINPRLNIAGVLMTQRYFGFGNPYSFMFKSTAYRALGH